ncbi:hypothetical protein TWF694_000814 [Orbilia ellipsospora]|uniref:Uncharacterized protein n=1 Tax=Orbilia ellipsospora TaxID=2528407 RepID=A0AAV9XPW6_9PEZI
MDSAASAEETAAGTPVTADDSENGIESNSGTDSKPVIELNPIIESAPATESKPLPQTQPEPNPKDPDEPKSDTSLEALLAKLTAQVEELSKSKLDAKSETKSENKPEPEEKKETEEKTEEDALELPYCEVDPTGDVLATCYLPKSNTDASKDGPIGVLLLCSKALSLASPLLRETLKQTPTSSQISNDNINFKKISFITSCFDEAFMVMNIIHHQNSLNAKTLTLAELYNLALFCDAYQLQEAVLPSVDSWVKSLWPGPSHCSAREIVATNSGVTSMVAARGKRTILPLHKTTGIESHKAADCVKWLWIAHVFGFNNITEECGHTAILNIRVSMKENLFEVDGVVFQPLMSVWVQEILWAQREILIKQLIDSIEGKVSKFRNSMARNVRICKATSCIADQCDIYQLGKLFKLKLKLGYPDTKLKFQSLIEIYEVFRETFGTTTEPNRGHGQAYGYDVSHKGCDVFEDLQVAVQDIEQLDLRPLLN